MRWPCPPQPIRAGIYAFLTSPARRWSSWACAAAARRTFLWQCLEDRLAAGAPRDALLFFSFEDERLAEMTTGELQLVVEEYFNLCPERRDRERVTFFLDEIQLAPGWEPFTRRNDEIYCLARRAR